MRASRSKQIHTLYSYRENPLCLSWECGFGVWMGSRPNFLNWPWERIDPPPPPRRREKEPFSPWIMRESNELWTHFAARPKGERKVGERKAPNWWQATTNHALHWESWELIRSASIFHYITASIPISLLVFHQLAFDSLMEAISFHITMTFWVLGRSQWEGTKPGLSSFASKIHPIWFSKFLPGFQEIQALFVWPIMMPPSPKSYLVGQCGAWRENLLAWFLQASADISLDATSSKPKPSTLWKQITLKNTGQSKTSRTLVEI